MAKAEGIKSVLPQSLADLFPDSLEDSRIGEIPKGWLVKSLAELTSYLSRGISPAYTEAGGTLVLNQKCIRGGRVDITKGRRHDPAKRSAAGRTLLPGDILVNSTGVGTLGRVAQVVGLEEDTIVDSHVTVVRANGVDATWNFLGIALSDREQEIERLGEGSTGQTELSRARLASLLLAIPNSDLMAEFDRLCIPLRHRVHANEESSRTVAATRDALLPRLISGELRVKHAERIVGEHV